jgi:hypothetical protein
MGLLSTLYYDTSLKSSRGLITPVRPAARYGYTHDAMNFVQQCRGDNSHSILKDARALSKG